MITPDIPSDARSIIFTADNGKRGAYYFWQRWERTGHDEYGNSIKAERWYWYALGGSGVEDCCQDATSAARAWIRDGHRSLIR